MTTSGTWSALVANHPQLPTPMAAGLSEVSVFWTDEAGRRRRARFDKLLPSYILDPKSYGAHNQGPGRSRPGAAHGGRPLLRRAAVRLRRGPREAGRVHPGREGVRGHPRERAWLGGSPRPTPSGWPSAWSSTRTAIPISSPRGRGAGCSCRSPPTPRATRPSCCRLSGRVRLTWRAGKQKVEAALENFDYYKTRFGLGDEPNEDGLVPVPWATVRNVWRPLDEEFPSWLGDVRAAAAQPEEEETDDE
jgi:hypothetical protein